MNGRFLFSLLSLLSVLVYAQPHSPTPEQIAALKTGFQAHVISVNGSRNPAGLPYGVVMEAAFNRFAQELHLGEATFRDIMRARFSGNDADMQQIIEYASRAEHVMANVMNEESRSTDEACAPLVGLDLPTLQTMGARSVAERFEQIKANTLDALEAHYREAVDGLSPSTRSALLSYVDTNVRASMSWGTFDNVGFAVEWPDAFLWNRKLSCERWMEMPSSAKTWKKVDIPIIIDSADVQENVPTDD